MQHPCILVILDGWGYREDTSYNAIAQARPTTMQMLMERYPWTTLEAAGTAVGTLPGYAGNSQIGHMTIGSGTMIEQPLMALSIAIQSGYLDRLDKIQRYITDLAQTNTRLHIMGLLSDGGVHSHEMHVHELLRYIASCGITRPILHPFLDGRDVPSQSAEIYLDRLERVLHKHTDGCIATIMGRYYAMDRDNNWDRTLRAYNCITKNTGDQDNVPTYDTWRQAITAYYKQGTTDEFIPPTYIGNTDTAIHEGDAVIFFNFRADRARQFTALLQNQFDITQFTFHDDTDTDNSIWSTYSPCDLSWMITGSVYHPTFDTIALYQRPRPQQTLCDVLADNNKRIYRIAETQKYAHVTYFFNGGDEQVYDTETRVMVPSLHVSTYRDHPEMSAQEITDRVAQSLEHDPHDFYLINYANPDMVGHTGDFAATKQAITCVDNQIHQLYELAYAHNAELHITADHGNAEDMYYPDRNMPRTSHTNNPVPYIIVSPNIDHIPTMYGLADIAPYILTRMELSVPTDMYNSYIS